MTLDRVLWEEFAMKGTQNGIKSARYYVIVRFVRSQVCFIGVGDKRWTSYFNQWKQCGLFRLELKLLNPPLFSQFLMLFSVYSMVMKNLL